MSIDIVHKKFKALAGVAALMIAAQATATVAQTVMAPQAEAQTTQVRRGGAYALLSGPDQMGLRVEGRGPAVMAVFNLTENYLVWRDASDRPVAGPDAQTASRLIGQGRFRTIGSLEAAGSAADRATYVLFSDQSSAEATMDALRTIDGASVGRGDYDLHKARTSQGRVVVAQGASQQNPPEQDNSSVQGQVRGAVNGGVNQTTQDAKNLPGQVVQDAVNQVQIQTWQVEYGIRSKVQEKVGGMVGKIFGR